MAPAPRDDVLQNGAESKLSSRFLMTEALRLRDDTYDPFAEFSEATGAAGQDPFPLWLERQAAPGSIHEGEASPDDESGLGDFMCGGRRTVSVYSFALADEVFRDADLYSNRILAESVGLVWGRTIIEMDEPEHRRYKKLLQKVFSYKEMDRWEREIVRPLLDSFLDNLDPERADLLPDLMLAFPATVIGQAIGLPQEDLPLFFRLAVEMTNIATSPHLAFAAAADLGTYLQGQIDLRRAEPGPDLLSQLVEARVEPEDRAAGEPDRLTDEQIISYMRLLLIGGAETTARSTSTLLLLLLQHPEQLEMVRRDRSLIPAAVEESLRLQPPLTISTKVVTADTTLAGWPLQAEDAVQVVMAAANRDPARWERPHEFDITRRPQQTHMAFTLGPHLCLGMHLARMEMRVVLEEVLNRYPHIRLDPDAGPSEIRGRELRCPNQVPVLFTPATTSR